MEFFTAIFLILGTADPIISAVVFFTPLPTFYQIYKKKSTEGFESDLPYAMSMSLLRCMLLVLYGHLKKTEDGLIIFIVNLVGCAIYLIYIFLYIKYTTQEYSRSSTIWLISFVILAYGLLVLIIFLATDKGPHRVAVVGWISSVCSVCVFAAPLWFLVRKLGMTPNNDQYMSLKFYFDNAVCAVMWCIYGLLINDYYVATSNGLGFMFGVALYIYKIFKDKPQQVITPMVQQEDLPASMVVELGAITPDMQEKARS